eukprot:CAMPEP_0202901116 /NCGR_PEP_ID=MMETSP1392-20130828/13377_1 /ASSEMBLY_ACC=CAM_ASM_000868 /TAXON_ID=225041 /ORGANISM="Chlamydomonas chlamydogama, Strain SAG 11-48b" /LENGTH=101 /DNA_ID=CAMNT_0049587621 /DNA_START=229 /DNA_END=531 /DNA_ORIENTATION=-
MTWFYCVGCLAHRDTRHPNYDEFAQFHHLKEHSNHGRALTVGDDGNLHIGYCQHFNARTLSYKPYHGPVHTWAKGVPDWVLEHEEIRENVVRCLAHDVGSL